MAKEKDMNIQAVKTFIKEVTNEHKDSGAREHSYRLYLVNLIKALGDDKITVRNEGEKIGGITPDITVKRNKIPIGYIEAKDITVNIDDLKGANISQFNLYKKQLPNLIYTNNLDWDFYRDGNLVRRISIAKLSKSGKITEKPETYDQLAVYLQDFLDQRPQTIKSAKELTKYMVRKTIIIGDSFREGLLGKNRVPRLETQYKTISKQLIRWLKKEEFADMYAQTLTYGLFVARLHSTPKTLNRNSLQTLVPEHYSFLKDLFEFIANKTLGNTLNDYIDDLIEIYRAADDKIMKDYKKGPDGKDPFLHFYEDFLKEYDSKERTRKGVYYTPDDVVDFIVRGVDWVLKNKFDLEDGLADSEKTTALLPNKKMGKKQFDSVHRVQILDPATGTGTFLAQTIRHIEKHIQETNSGSWPAYIDTDLLPRLHGFEIMMAPYVMCYLKLNMLLDKLDYTPKEKNPQRMSIYLTDSLTGANKEIPNFGFGNEWLEEEARGAKDIKDNQPIMCVIGNPPYNANSKNKDKWILDLMDDYKKEPNTEDKLDEDNILPLNNDYVKFIRMAQNMVEKKGEGAKKEREGVVGMITGHGFLEGPTFRGMRWNLMNSFDEIYVLDLHGNNVKETGENVFANITTGVSILIAWKKKRAEGADKPLAKVFRGDLFGTREEKFKALRTGSLDSGLFNKIEPCAGKYYFTAQDCTLLEEYETGFAINKFMPKNSNGIKTHRDNLVFDIDEQKLHDRIETFYDISKTPKKIKDKFNIKETDAWSISKARETSVFNEDLIKPCAFRPFDARALYYSPDLIDRDRRDVMRHYLEDKNVGLLFRRGHESIHSAPVFCTKTISGGRAWSARKERSIESSAPLYLYTKQIKEKGQDKMKLKMERSVNMDEGIRKVIEDIATDAKHGKPDEYAIFDYIYGILHAPDYREHYGEFLKTEFPCIPYPKTPAEFWYLSSVGTKLRDLHLMDTTKIKFDLKAYPFKGKGDCKVATPYFDNKRAFINKTQYFDNVPESAWNSFIGGYQPAQEWLNNRKKEILNLKNLKHYQRIIAVLVQTEQTMQTIKWNRP